MRINLSTINKAKAAATQDYNGAIKAATNNKLDVVTRWFAFGEAIKAGREALLWALAEAIEKVMDVQDWTFSASVKPYFEAFDSGESAAFAKLDPVDQRKFAKAWSEVVAVTKAKGSKASARRVARKQDAEVPTYNKVREEALALTAEEQERLVKSLAKALGIKVQIAA